MKMCSILLVISEMQIKPSYVIIYPRDGKKKQKILIVGKDVSSKNSQKLWVGIQIGSTNGRQFGNIY